MIPQDRTMYLELAKMNRNNRKMIMMYFKNYVRALKNERDAAGTATQVKRLSN